MVRKVVVVSLVVVVGLGGGVALAAWWTQFHGESGPEATEALSTPTAVRSPVPTFPAEPSPTPSPNPSPEPQFPRDTHSLDNAASPWVVVNKQRPLDPVDFVPGELVTLTGVPGGGSQQMQAQAAADFLDMAAHASDDGFTLRVTTAYRSYNFQDGLYRRYLADWGRERAETFVARPGHSEHQTGLAVDVYDTEACRLKECFAESDTYAWLERHAANYGFIVRYPDGLQDVTGYRYEPWHLRWVGRELAFQMHLEGALTMEEFFDLPAAPDYNNE